MFAPFRAVLLRRNAPLALLLAASSVSLLFAATPFLIPEVANRYGVSLGAAGLISSVQVAGFAASAFFAGRRITPSRRMLVGAAAVGVAVNAASAVMTSFTLLLVLRLVAGGAAGVFTWLAWADAMRADGSMRDIAAVGPLTVLVGAPVLAWIGSLGGDRAIYAFLAVSPIPATLIPVSISTAAAGERRRVSPSRSNVVLLIGLGTMAMAGSSFFVFVGAFAGDEVGLGAVALSLGFSVHAVAGLIGARIKRPPDRAWPFMLGVVASVLTISLMPTPATFFVGMAGWGVCFWIAVPRLLNHIASWSFVAEERVGDAQGIMALGRAVGPGVASLLVGSGRYGGVVAFCVIGTGAAAGLVGGVESYRSGRSSPVG